MIDMRYADALAGGDDVWCDRAEQVAAARNTR